MARIFMDGFEHGKPTSTNGAINDDYIDGMWLAKQALSSYITPDSYIGANSTAYFGGDYSVRFLKIKYQCTHQCIYRQLPSTYNKLYARFYVRRETEGEYPTTVAFFGMDDTAGYSSSLSMGLRLHSGNGTLSLYVNNTSVASVSNSLIASTWHLIEVLYDNAGSNIVVKQDNAEVINYSGTIDSAIQYVSIGKCDIASNGGEWLFYIDDFAINDDSGTVNNSWIGAGVIRLIKPTSDDTNADFTPSTGSDHYALVDDFPDDGDTTYNSSTVSGDIDTFGLESVPSVATGQTINAVQAVYRARSETDVASVAPILISGATTDTGATQSTVLSDYNDTKQKVYDVDPNTSAQWTEANVNAVKGGYKNAT